MIASAGTPVSSLTWAGDMFASRYSDKSEKCVRTSTSVPSFSLTLTLAFRSGFVPRARGPT